MFLCFSVCFFLMVGSIVLLSFLLTVTVSHFAEGHPGVKILLIFEASLKNNEVCCTGSSFPSKSSRKVSRKYETLGTGFDLSGEDFQNTGSFMVVRSSVFAVNSAQKTHLARDAFNA